MATVDIKIVYNKNSIARSPQDIRRLRIPVDTTLVQFIDYVKLQQPNIDFETENVQFQYLDEENDYVQFSTQDEWAIALDTVRLSKQQPKALLRIIITCRGKKSGAPKDVTPKTRHYGIICDGCNKQNFTGNRYKCQNCVDWDYCEKCFSSSDVRKKHYPNHMFTKITSPVQKHNDKFEIPRHHGVCCDGCGAYNFTGTRHKCEQCADYDLCDTCINKPSLRLQHFNGSHHYKKIEAPIHRVCPYLARQMQQQQQHINVMPSAPVQEEKPIEKVEEKMEAKPEECAPVQEEKPIEKVEEKVEAKPEECAPVQEEEPVERVEEKLEEPVQVKEDQSQIEEKKPLLEQDKKEEEAQPPQPFSFIPWRFLSTKPQEEPVHMHELDQLYAMGFTDSEKNKTLLKKFNGDVTAVVQHLLDD